MFALLSAFAAPQLVRSLGKSSAQLSTSAAQRAPAIVASGHPAFVNPYANAPAPSESELSVIRSTVPVLAEHGLTLTKMFYQRMFSKHPELKNVFNQAHQKTEMQPKALAAAVYAYAANIDNLAPVLPAVRLMAHKHASLSILPSQYPIVGTNLLASLEELLTAAKFPADTIKAVIGAWATAYGQLANILISEEEKLYKAAESAQGGWRGWRKFVVDERVVECEGSSSITTFYLRPQEGGAVPSFHPGQYTCVRIPVQEGSETYMQPRQYSLSGVPDGKRLKISIKREDADNLAAVAPAPHPMPAGASASKCPFLASRPAGVVSNLLHAQYKVGSVVELAPPFGDFTIESMAPAALPKTEAPLVLVAAGVGLTPMVPMLETALAAGRPTSLIYGCHSGSALPMRSWLHDLRTNKQPQQVQARLYFSKPEAADRKGTHFDESGRINIEKADALVLRLDQPDAQYFVCGPPAFMRDVAKGLRERGVQAERIHSEHFGSGSE